MITLSRTLSTDTIIARDAFRGMMETLSNSEKDIHRATRLAFNCAKNGIAKEVIELIVQKMENEPSMSRRVEFFFIVDAITQLSKRRKDTAEASFIHIIEAHLPRLLLAAAPHWMGAQENQRQLVKVLRLWIERKIFPESDLQRYVNNIQLLMKNSYPADRDVNGQEREIDGMLAESGSNVYLKHWPPLPPDSPPQDPPLPSSPPPLVPPPPPLDNATHIISHPTMPNLSYPPPHGYGQEYKTVKPSVSIPPPSVRPSNHFTFLNTIAEKPHSEYRLRIHEPLPNSSISGPLPPLERQLDNNVFFQPICVSQRPLAPGDGFQTAFLTTVASRPPTPGSSQGQPMMWYGQHPTSHGYSKPV